MLFFLTTINCLEYFIKDYYTDRFLTSEEKGNQSPYFSKKARPDLFDVNESQLGNNKGVIKALSAKPTSFNSIKNPETEKKGLDSSFSVLTVGPSKKTVIYYPFYDGLEQFMYLKKADSVNKFKIMHEDSCIGYNENVFVFELVDCAGPNVSYFSLIPPQDYVKPDSADG
ncbi:hypothetical protein EDEG_02174 [Edhazardia aedis USNM 41457]|uniref:Uncharacterized protein n=1 Tax=Edhazardia aedis (strain USNM 41457) TaxID=1003232 RepID=J8ZUX1_EDHAE|nr:hypothetical protein EDEG_02174 [Edhazardia aedis USNM 41457]|eukprot:EJW03478.1 hypothetical protein EDEG_02174 [Edhazardia aedis USNM 41457]